jgi:hypothetical protein
MLRSPAWKKIVLIWLVWWLCLFAFQAFVTRRFQPQRPDTALEWNRTETGKTSQNNKPYLLDAFLNEHVSWDSEFYLGVADAGYDNPRMRMIPGPDGQKISISYAFFPLYPVLMRFLAAPLALLGLSRIGTLTLAGLVIALLGTLGAMLALYDLARGWLGEPGGLRAAYYLLIFPTGFFLAQVYTEGLFLGLAFGALALIQRRKLGWAAPLVALAIWTRAVGVALIVPMTLAAVEQIRKTHAAGQPPRAIWRAAAAALTPFLALAAWWVSPLRPAFQFIEDNYFSRHFLALDGSFGAWGYAWQQMTRGANGPTEMYYGLEFLLIVLGLLGSLALLRKMPLVALFSLAVFVISFFSGVGQSMNRYVLALPALFMSLAKLGEDEVFDRGWTLASVLLLGALAALFSYDMWVG